MKKLKLFIFLVLTIRLVASSQLVISVEHAPLIGVVGDFRLLLIDGAELEYLESNKLCVLDLSLLTFYKSDGRTPLLELPRLNLGTHTRPAGMTVKSACLDAVITGRIGKKGGFILDHPVNAMFVTYISQTVVFREIYWNLTEAQLATKLLPGDILVVARGL